MGDSTCAPNCDIDSTYIDMFQTSTSEKKRQKRDPEYEKVMRKIRRKFICSKCRKYPGDDEWSLGSWDNGPYTCFDCT